MGKIFHEILDWSEVWALLIPLIFILVKRNIPAYLKPIRLYIWIALLINICANAILFRNKLYLSWIPEYLHSNNFLYNIHSIVRLLLFSWFFILLNQRFMHRVKAVFPFLFILVAIINFTFFEDFFDFYMLSSRLHATEAAILLFYCLQYFIYLMIDDNATTLKNQPGFWVVTGLSIYVAANFFIFLFYNYLLKQNLKVFAVNIWDVHNVVFIILCICIAINFSKKYEH
jgi:hypothetical protein